MVNNADWLEKLQYIDFLRDVGRHFTINRMLTMDSVKLRLDREQPLTFLEFNYMIMQGYDFVELNKRYGCTLADGRLGPVGQYRAGRRTGPPHERSAAVRPHHAADHHLLRRQDGQDRQRRGVAERRTPVAYDYWQFWRNTEDGDVGRFLRLFTDLPLDEIARLEQLKDAEINTAKEILATEATRLCHGDESARESAATAARAFAGNAAEGLPTFVLKAGEPALVIDVTIALGMASSKSEARRLIDQGGVRLNDQP